ncbi:class I SAM-dependent methyltransferase [Actinocorallia populi]|uniref:class I SAM-dependent methyltransferase n=1 Tax=Actinocorallia populi TaxID=2079200 RepID=UPI0018E58F48|nr:methyltransferase domain-containing protein [Actinocorallia populi]
MAAMALFFREFVRTRRDTGAIAPSGPSLASALTRYVVPGSGRPRAVLEVGPGTGAVTRRVRASMGSLDTLDLAEANPRFAALLQRTHGRDARVRLLEGPVQEHELGAYDTIVCGLPFANFDEGTVEDLFGRLLGALRPGGTLSFFAYAGLPVLRRTFAGDEERRRARRTQAVIARTLQRHRFRAETVLGNLPPARVHHLAAVAPAPAYSG